MKLRPDAKAAKAATKANKSGAARATRAVTRAARPVARLVISMVTRAIGPRLGALEAAHGETWSDVQKLKADSTAMLDGLRATQEYAAEQVRRLDRIEGRVELVRRELLFELRYGGRSQGIGVSSASSDEHPAVVVGPKVLNEAKLRSFGDDIRLNLGAGHLPADGYLNVDARELPGIDIVADIRALPFGPGEVSTLFCAHLLEHFPVEEVRRSLLPYWRSILKPEGSLVVVVPDSESMLDAYAKGEFSFSDLREVTFGGQEYDGDFHFNMYSRDSLIALLTEAGFDDVAITVSGRANGLCREMEAVGRRREDPLRGDPGR